MLRGGLVKRTGSHHDGVGRCSEETHNETVRLVESADIASSGLAGDFVADHAIDSAHEVTDHIRPLGAGWWEPQIAAIGKPQSLREDGRPGCLPAVDQRADNLWQGPLLGRRLGHINHVAIQVYTTMLLHFSRRSLFLAFLGCATHKWRNSELLVNSRESERRATQALALFEL